MGKQPNSHVTISRSGGTDIGLNLAYDAANKRYYYQDFRVPRHPESELSEWMMVQDNWHAGMGQYRAGRERTLKYGESTGWDLRNPGKATLFSDEAAVTVTQESDPAESFSNLGFETWPDATTPADWTVATGMTATREAAEIDEGTYSCKLVTTDTDKYIQQGVVITGGTHGEPVFQWRKVVLSGRGYSDTADNLRLYVYCGYQNKVYSTYHTGDSAWADMKVVMMIHGGATYVQIGVEKANDDSGGATNDYVDDFSVTIETMSSNQTPGGYLVSGSNFYYWEGMNLYKWDSSNSRFIDYFKAPALRKCDAAWLYEEGDQSTDETTDINDDSSSGDVALLASVSDTGDYFGLGSSVKYWGVIFKANTLGTGDYDLDVEYYNGTSWGSVASWSDQSDMFKGAYISKTGHPYWLMMWDVDNMADWATSNENYALGNYYEIKIIAQNATDPTIAPLADQAWLLEDSSSAVITSVVPQGDYLWIFIDNDHAMFYTDGSEVWFTHADYNNWGKFAVEHMGEVFTNLTDTGISRCRTLYDGSTYGTFDTPDELKTGPSSTVITGMASHGSLVFIGKEDNVYYTTVYQEGSANWAASQAYSGFGFAIDTITPRFNSFPDSDNFKRMKSIDNIMYLPHTKGLWVWEGLGSSGTIRNLSPKVRFPEYGDYLGEVKAIAAGQDWTYLIIEPVSGNSNAKVMAIREEAISGAEIYTDYRWHSLAEVSLSTIHDAVVYSDYLWICGTSSGTAYIKRFSLDGANYPSDGNGIKVEYATDGGSSWTELGGTDNGTFTASGTKDFSAGATGKSIRLRLTSASKTFTTQWMDFGSPGESKVFGSITLTGTSLTANTTTTTPELNSITIRAVVDAGSGNNVIRQWDFKAMMADDVPPVGATGNLLPAKELRSNLNDAADDSHVTFYDIWGSSHTAQIIPPTPDEQFVSAFKQSGDELQPQSVIHLTLREIP